MKTGNVEKLLEEKERLSDLLEDVMIRIQEIRKEITSGLDDLEDMIAEGK